MLPLALLLALRAECSWASFAGPATEQLQCEEATVTASSMLLQARQATVKGGFDADELEARGAIALVEDHRRGLDLHVMHNQGGHDPQDLQALKSWMGKLDQMFRDRGMAVTEGNSGQQPAHKEQVRYNEWATNGHLSTLCETGFNAGHSALRFLALSEAHVYEFDLGEHPYAMPAEGFLTDSFPGRLNVTWGDSTRTLPSFHEAHPLVKCSLMIVDGGHSYEVALSDLKSFAKMAADEHILAIDDTPCAKSYCEGPTRAWAELTASGCIEQLERVPMGAGRGFSVGRYASREC
uniref:Cephalosporin hydroxylase n=1 Tax=Pyrodinium bahamense TaxID=73915 RepID=A0A7S0AWE8_9DINO|mmetsp:Transcript_43670/g.121370  ORF Transcript_43670/g.121370 Transcript_43670/m.121370 type:complete len:294 (+) Transcript_43670:104-985(+)